ncbi:lytic polysaccharide monooxygenase [Xylona heveae TC161]|uniref:Lytic polysaccharide monooxygenase n=1 Tax=Xylona heveae (strain CBS 132557 / TC161) TaxID=1328760 RepID=A0A165HX75_XYLHT|nr:lytic polysaccharide monooxygenase [Xylona heveae TC161]KZF24053.1 lytic polysaccharide monooxygenase [Xylona heveae TC161]
MHCILFLLYLFVTAVIGHMQLFYPPPFNASNNPHLQGSADEFLQFPYNCCGRQTPFPCRGYLDLLGTDAGAPVATWSAGSNQSWSMTGIGNHWGGSCQVGFSIDNGETFQVAASYPGNCPHRLNGDGPTGQEFNFTVPADIPSGEAIFAWTWINREQEFNMNCAAINITGPDSSSAAFSVPYSQRPGLLIADTGNGCWSPKTTAEVLYPNPGPDVIEGDNVYTLEKPYPPEACGY